MENFYEASRKRCHEKLVFFNFSIIVEVIFPKTKMFQVDKHSEQNRKNDLFNSLKCFAKFDRPTLKMRSGHCRNMLYFVVVI